MTGERAAGGRSLLSTLRALVQEIGQALDLSQALEILVERIRGEMRVDVCSVYLRDRDAEELVLRATLGLEPESVGRLRLPVGEGLVGLVAKTREPVNVDDAAVHPAYHHFPDSGEDAFRAFLGVPLLHYRELTGVLVVQDRACRRFLDQEIDFLVTVSAQLAGVLSNVAVAADLRKPSSSTAPSGTCLKGIAGAPGVAIGVLVSDAPGVAVVAPEGRPPVDPENELERFRDAVEKFDAELEADALDARDMLRAGLAPLFDAYRLILHDETLLEAIRSEVRQGSSAEAALGIAVNRFAAVFEAMEDPYQRARSSDVRAIGERLRHHLLGTHAPKREYPPNTVLAGAEVSLPRILDVPGDRLSGIVCSGGSLLSHTVVVARALEVPVVMGLGTMNPAELEGRRVVVDGFTGQVWIDPAAEVLTEYDRILVEERAIDRSLAGEEELPSVTLDGVEMALHGNVGIDVDIERALRSKLAGVGLYRSEFLFMLRDAFPSEDEQYVRYREVLESFAPRPVTIRTLDIGGDKPLSYFPITESNSFLGWRGIRVTLDHPELFLTQLRALLRADEGLGNLRILLPMVSRVEEVDETAGLLEQALGELRADGLQVSRPPLGVLVEVPAVLHDLEAFVEVVDFLSIGSNDLTQHLLAVDRSNAHVADLYDPLQPAVLRALASLISGSQAAGVPIGVCGQIAGDPVAAVLLVGFGVDWLSMAPSATARVKSVVRAIRHRDAQSLARAALASRSSAEVRDLLARALDDAGLGLLKRSSRG